MSYWLIAKTVEMLERSHCSSLQYSRRESIEISGIPLTVADKDLENKSLEILQSIGVAKINPLNIHACHRLKNRNNTILWYPMIQPFITEVS